jgi:hypothetical protein
MINRMIKPCEAAPSVTQTTASTVERSPDIPLVTHGGLARTAATPSKAERRAGPREFLRGLAHLTPFAALRGTDLGVEDRLARRWPLRGIAVGSGVVVGGWVGLARALDVSGPAAHVAGRHGGDPAAVADACR